LQLKNSAMSLSFDLPLYEWADWRRQRAAF